MSRAKIEELVQLVATGPEAIRSLGSNFGFVLGNKGDWETAADYGDAVGVRTSQPFHDPSCSQAFVRGYLACVRDISTSYVRGHEERLATDPDALATWVEGCEGGPQILKLAQEKTVIRLDEVSALLGPDRESQWLQLMYEMRRRRILVPIPGFDRQALTLLGVRVLETLERKASP